LCSTAYLALGRLLLSTAATTLPVPLAAAFASHLTQARRLGALSGFVHGTSAITDGSVQGTMRQFETIIK
jgi:hypothetical protein